MFSLFLFCFCFASESPEQGVRIIQIKPYQEGVGLLSSGEYGEDVLFTNTHTRGRPEGIPPEIERVLTQMSQYFSSFLEEKPSGKSSRYQKGPNPLFVRYDFFKETGEICGSIYTGLFISGSSKIMMDEGTCKKVLEAERTFEQFSRSEVVKDFSKGRMLVPSDTSKDRAFCKLPRISVSERSFPPVSVADLSSSDSGYKDSILLRFAYQFLFKVGLAERLFGHPAENGGQTLGCFSGALEDCFLHSEQAWLEFLKTPRPAHIFFSEGFDASAAVKYSVVLISYRDLCRYCRGTFSYLLHNGFLEMSLTDFLAKLPQLMKIFWEKYKIPELPLEKFAKTNIKFDNLYACSYVPIDDIARGMGK